LNDPPYGTERTYNGLRTAMALQKEQAAEAWVFLMADSVLAAMAGQKTPDGFYNLERMLKAVIAKGGRVKFCGSCADARGLTDAMLLSGVERGSMAELASWVAESDKSLVF
jgi:uncharacterized protein involved in oxidation of intracellular sulfur